MRVNNLGRFNEFEYELGLSKSYYITMYKLAILGYLRGIAAAGCCHAL